MNLKTQINIDRNQFIEKNRKFIYSTAQLICRRPLQWENDDELSVAMIAFNKACDTYNEDRGNFYSYARVLMKNALIDYFRRSSNTPYLIFDEERAEYIDHINSYDNYLQELQRNILSDEIDLFASQLADYKLSFKRLTDYSPSHKDTRDDMLNIALSCCRNKDIMAYLYKNKRLPVKRVSLLTGVKIKTIEKWRRYIIALVLILASNDYIYLKSYLGIKMGDVYEK